MIEKIKFILGEFGSFLWPLVKQFLQASAPAIKQAALEAVKETTKTFADKVSSNAEKHNNAYNLILMSLFNKGLEYGKDFSESMIDVAIAAAVKQLK